MFGPHLTLDLYGCDEERLKSGELLHSLLDELPGQVGMHRFSAPRITEVPERPDSFDRGGLTGFVILVESHIAIHTFPADRYASLDIFSVKQFSQDRVVRLVCDRLGAEKAEKNLIVRGREFTKHYPRDINKSSELALKERLFARG